MRTEHNKSHNIRHSGIPSFNHTEEIGYLKTNFQNEIIAVDDRAAHLLGYDAKALLGHNFWDIICTSIPAYCHQAINASIIQRKNSIIKMTSLNTGLLIHFTITHTEVDSTVKIEGFLKHPS